MRKNLSKCLVAAGATLAVTAAPAAAAPGSPGKATCEIFGTPVSGGACIKFQATGELNGSAFVQNCRLITEGNYPFTFYPEGGPFPPTTVKSQGECKRAVRFFHSQVPSE